MFAGRAIEVVYHNVDRLDYGSYEIKAVRIDEQPAIVELHGDTALLQRVALLSLFQDHRHSINIVLGHCAG